MTRVGLAAALAVLVCWTLPARGADVEGFAKTWAQAQKLAAQQKKPIYIHFTTTWCGWCRKIESDTYTDPVAKKALGDFVCASLDCTVAEGQKPSKEAKINIDLMEKYKGEGYPFLVMLTGDGAFLHSFSGYLPVADFVKELAKAKEVNAEYAAFLASAAKADPKSYDYNLEAMKVYAKVWRFKESAEAAQRVLALDPTNAKGDALAVKLILLQAAVREDQPAKVNSLALEVRKLDPKNEKFGLEEALLAQAALHFADASKPGPQAAPAAREMIKILQPLTAPSRKLKNGMNVYGILVQANMQLGQTDKAIEAAKGALACVPKDSDEAKGIQQFIDKLQGDTTPKTQPSD